MRLTMNLRIMKIMLQKIKATMRTMNSITQTQMRITKRTSMKNTSKSKTIAMLRTMLNRKIKMKTLSLLLQKNLNLGDLT